jgi:hypothetical protein
MMNKIDSRSKTIREMLDGAKYSIEYYQREYKWGTKQIAELLEDLEARFFSNYEEGHERRQVREYAPYLAPVRVGEQAVRGCGLDQRPRLVSSLLLLCSGTERRIREDRWKTLASKRRVWRMRILPGSG